MRIVCMSDTHGDHKSVNMKVPDGDVLVHAGDFTTSESREHAEDFNKWLGILPHRYKIVVEGNHECKASWKHEVCDILTNAIFLRQSGVSIGGVVFFGTAFFWPASNGYNPNHFDIPTNTDVLITHYPPKYIRDEGIGCEALLQTTLALKPRCVVFGHTHDDYGVLQAKWKNVADYEPEVIQQYTSMGLIAPTNPQQLPVFDNLDFRNVIQAQPNAVTYVNAALSGHRHVIKRPIVVDL
eukprot:c4995_g1_i1.p2 GENE.c4995_g1_i1~~c4995_g1_i1.p2  ORF type:complete len:239 (-),score=51.49 c4995_g1_i1:47-763(-)